MKTDETKIIEQILLQSCFGSNPRLAKEYGTNEVTLNTYQLNKGGKELVDFLSWDPNKNIIKCFEIKVTMQDFKSNASKSWYGNYNYLVISKNLYEKNELSVWKQQIPSNVGIIVVNTITGEKETVKKSKKIDIAEEQKIFLKDSLLRTLFYQNQNDSWYLRR